MEAKCRKRCFRVGKEAFSIALFNLLTFLERHFRGGLSYTTLIWYLMRSVIIEILVIGCVSCNFQCFRRL
ncbi:hypothetical protein V8E51_002895 [Hyaloscypha variabilis]